MAYYELEPWGSEVEDQRAGIVSSTVANVNRDGKKRRKPYEAADFMPRHQRQVEEQSPDDQFEILKMLTRQFGGEVKE